MPRGKCCGWLVAAVLCAVPVAWAQGPLVQGEAPEALPPTTRFAVDEAILRGLEYIYLQALQDDLHFAKFGHDYLMCVDGVIVRSTNPIVRTRAKDIAHALGRKWKRLFSEIPEDVNASELSHLMFGLFALERMTTQSFTTMEKELRQALPNFDTDEFLHFDPHDEAPPASFPLPPSNPMHEVVNSREMVWYNALVHAYVAAKLRLPLGRRLVEYQHILDHFAILKPYKSVHTHESPVHATDHLYAMANLVWTLSDYGRLRLRESDFPRLFQWFLEHLPTFLANKDLTAVAVAVDCLKLFGHGVDDDAHHHSLSLLTPEFDAPLVPSAAEKTANAFGHMTDQLREAVTTILQSQNSDGSWGSPRLGEQEVYHPTCAAMYALCEHSHAGFGPSIPHARVHDEL